MENSWSRLPPKSVKPRRVRHFRARHAVGAAGMGLFSPLRRNRNRRGGDSPTRGRLNETSRLLGELDGTCHLSSFMVLHGRESDISVIQTTTRGVSTTPTPRARRTTAASLVSYRDALSSPPSPDTREPRQAWRAATPSWTTASSRSSCSSGSATACSGSWRRRTPAPRAGGARSRARSGMSGTPTRRARLRGQCSPCAPCTSGATPSPSRCSRCSAVESRARSPRRARPRRPPSDARRCPRGSRRRWNRWWSLS